MTGTQEPDGFQSCIDTACESDWDGHTAEEKEGCRAAAELDALRDLHDRAQLQDALTTEPHWAQAEIAEREQLAALLRPEADTAASREAER